MRNRGFSASNRHSPIRIAIAFVIVIVVGGLIWTVLNRGTELLQGRVEQSQETVSVMDLWNDAAYGEVARISERQLMDTPLDRDALLFAGYSRFFTAMSRLSLEERSRDLDAAIGHLRRLRARGGTPNPERVDYVLGKAYLLKGPYWADLAVLYLQSSIDAGYEAGDLYEFMGRSHSALGDLETALEWYEAAAGTHPTDRLLITLGEDAFKLARYNDAADYYKRAIAETRDEELQKRGLSQLGQLYYDVGNYAQGRGVLERLVELENGNEDYWFLLGETYHELGMTTEARSAWHRTARINPRHVGALRRLYD